MPLGRGGARTHPIARIERTSERYKYISKSHAHANVRACVRAKREVRMQMCVVYGNVSVMRGVSCLHWVSVQGRKPSGF